MKESNLIKLLRVVVTMETVEEFDVVSLTAIKCVAFYLVVFSTQQVQLQRRKLIV